MPYKPLFLLLILSSCSASRITQTDLYFGQTRPDGSLIAESDWKAFKESRIDKIFKEGSTLIKVTGNWFDPDSHKLITEPTNLVIYFHKNSRDMSQQIDSIRYWYKTMFQQQSILRVDRKAKASF